MRDRFEELCMSSCSRDEIRAVHEFYLATRGRIEAGQLGWDALADFFSEDATSFHMPPKHPRP
jgi:hypothetical protein